MGATSVGWRSVRFVEATAVTAQGRIANGDLGIWSDAQVPALKGIAEFMKAWKIVPRIQLAHAGRKGSMQRPWFGNGAPLAEGLAHGEKKWDPVALTAEPMAEGHIVARQLSVSDQSGPHPTRLEARPL